MSPEDAFGLNREMKVVSSGVRKVFTPHKPIDSVDLFRGRKRQARQLIEQMNTPGQHALLYGDRGVGKTSLANIVSELMTAIVGGVLHKKYCDSSETFETIVEKPLKHAGVNLHKVSHTERRTQGGSAGAKAFGVGADVTTEGETVETFDSTVSLRPSAVVDELQDSTGLLVVDEADSVSAQEDRKKLAEFIKLLSDSNAGLKVLVVGIAETGGELVGEHPSVQRCLKETKLGGMTEEELAAIITEGAAELEIRFEDDVVERIVQASGGYPHFTHLLALKCAEEAIAEDRGVVTAQDLGVAMESAVDDAEGSLARRYKDAIRSYNTDMYRVVLLAAASIASTEFTAARLREAIKEDTGEAITQNRLNNYLNRLVSDGRETVLRRLRKGVYTFNDPRMPTYVKIANRAI